MEKPFPSLPPSYVTLKQLQELRLREKAQWRGNEEEERLKREEEEARLRPTQGEEEKDRLRAPRPAPKPRRPYRRRSNGPKPRSADPEATPPKDADNCPIGTAVVEAGVNLEAGEADLVNEEDPEKKSKKKKKKKKKNSRWKKNFRKKKEEEENGSGAEGPNRAAGEYPPVRSPVVEPDRAEENSQRVVDRPDRTGGRVESRGGPRRDRDRGRQRTVVIPRKAENPVSSGGDWRKEGMGRGRTVGGRGGLFNRERKATVGRGEGLVWVRKETVL